MAKKSSKRGRSSRDATVWSACDHDIRKAKRQRKSDEKREERENRSALLTRGSREKREEGKLRLHIVRVQRQVERLRSRLEVWDDVEEKANRVQAEELEKQKAAEEASSTPKKKKGRKGPETWKLKGAARPAYQVYDFDTRYIDPHSLAHEEAKKKAGRCRNLIQLYRGRFGNEESHGGPPQPQCREFLALLMQLGLLHVQAKKFKSARGAFLECMELDSMENPITPARCHLMRLYMEMNRPESARRLWERLSFDDPSVWIRYSAALVEFVSWKLLEEDGSTQESAERLLTHAIRSNVFCAYYLAFSDTFNDVMEYTDDIEDAHEGQSLEEAIEYCCSEQFGAWKGTDGALEWLREVVLRAIHGHPVTGNLSPEDLEWQGKLKDIKENIPQSDELGNEEADVGMFAAQFETAMDILNERGDLRRWPS